ncbi:MAG: hypothetical protein D6694_09360 [Gammaproteobacteria bacterium]|nr:MAG: hypothetical protein D6694_09360 [Gammaproteobacteria bacterium]
MFTVILIVANQRPSYSHPVVVNDLLNPSGTAVLQSVRGCLPPTPDTHEYPYRFHFLGRIGDPQAAGDSNIERPIAYLYISVFDTPDPSYVPWQTLIGLLRNGTCQNYIGQDAFVSLTNYMPLPLAVQASSLLYQYREGQADSPDAYRDKLQRAYGQGLEPDVTENPRTPAEQHQLDEEPCQLFPEWAAVVRSEGVQINPDVCRVLPVPRYPFWARPRR